jgi:hypothetical protein
MNVQCCVCAKVRDGGEWIHRGAPLAGEVTHTYCPQCKTQTLQAMRKELATANRTQPVHGWPAVARAI